MNDTLFSMPTGPVRPPKSTVISIVPWPILEFKPGLVPGEFYIPPSVNEEPECLLIGDSIHYVYIDHTRGSMRVVNPSYIVARSIVNDYNSAQIEANTGCHPGLFWVQGEYTPAQAKVNLAKELDTIRSIQNQWFEALVRIADDDWEKTRQHYAISDFQRYAAKKIDPDNKRNRPWILQAAAPIVDTTLCPACGSDIPASVAICRYCRFVVDKMKYDQMQFAAESRSMAQGAIEQARK